MVCHVIFCKKQLGTINAISVTFIASIAEGHHEGADRLFRSFSTASMSTG